MINGAHTIIYSSNPDADRAFLRDVLKLPYVEAGSGWLIFELPPGEVAVHPADNNIHELYFMCDDIHSLREELTGQDIPCTEIEALSWGQLIRITLPGGGALGIYQPRHARPASVA